MTELRCSVVIPTYNRLETLRHVIPTLVGQSLAPEHYELLVCDSNSNDGTREYLAEAAREHPNVRHLPGGYSGRAAARNAGIAAAQGRIVMFNDADILASHDLLERHLERHDAPGKIAIVGWEVQVKDLDDYAYKVEHVAERGYLHPPTRRRLSWLYFLTGNASVRRDDLLAVECFDESFTGYGHEDLELGYRLARAGVAILYEPRAVSYHCQDIGHEDQKEKMRLAGRSTVRFYRKHPDFTVRLNLGMTPLSLAAHSLLTRFPRGLAWLDRRASKSRLATNLVQQYHYVSGIKAALAER